MIKVRFLADGDLFCGFEICGHSGSAESGQDIICASVSSTAYMVANTLTEVLMCDSDADVRDGFMKFVIKSNLSAAQPILKGLELHLESLAKDYPQNIKVTS